MKITYYANNSFEIHKKMSSITLNIHQSCSMWISNFE